MFFGWRCNGGPARFHPEAGQRKDVLEVGQEEGGHAGPPLQEEGGGRDGMVGCGVECGQGTDETRTVRSTRRPGTP
jgi:hypothetical protein